MKDKILKKICEITLQVANQEEVKLSTVESNTVIYGEGSAIDSLDLVNILVELEEFLSKEFEIDIELIDEEALLNTNSPFRTPLALANYSLTKI